MCAPLEKKEVKAPTPLEEVRVSPLEEVLATVPLEVAGDAGSTGGGGG